MSRHILLGAETLRPRTCNLSCDLARGRRRRRRRRERKISNDDHILQIRSAVGGSPLDLVQHHRGEVAMKEEFLGDTHLLSWEGKDARADVVVLVVPGNPGSALFYTQFADALNDELAVRRVYVVGHAGHFISKGLRDDEYVGLHGQVEHKKRVIELLQQRERESPVRFLLIGHSIGSWICLTLRVSYPELPICGVVHCMPTFRHLYAGMTPFVRLAIQPWVTWALANVVHYCPIVVRKWLLWVAGHDTDEIKLVMSDHLDYFTIRNALQMAAEEAELVVDVREAHMDEIRSHGDMHFFVYSQRDHYTPLSYADDLRKVRAVVQRLRATAVIERELPCQEIGDNLRLVLAEPDVEHAFVIKYGELSSVFPPVLFCISFFRTRKHLLC
jgi:pimeloyl-ACP methyl ester carboxylesterase